MAKRLCFKRGKQIRSTTVGSEVVNHRGDRDQWYWSSRRRSGANADDQTVDKKFVTIAETTAHFQVLVNKLSPAKVELKMYIPLTYMNN